MSKTAAEKELQLIEKASREFARKVLLPERVGNDNYPFGNFFSDALEQAHKLGFFHTLLPDTLAGLGRIRTRFKLSRSISASANRLSWRNLSLNCSSSLTNGSRHSRSLPGPSASAAPRVTI